MRVVSEKSLLFFEPEFKGGYEMYSLKAVTPSEKPHIESAYQKVYAINFNAIKWKLTQSSEASMTVEACEFAVEEYRKFLVLKLLYPRAELVPNKLVDKMWHVHILDTKSYREDCNQVFGFFLDHFPYFGIYGADDQKQLAQAFEVSKKLYEKHFGAYPEQVNHASRCAEHACHSPSSCACRVSGACK
ncbi:MAG: hypothetical protein JKY53_12815 [Flavobacteriales bacterium]|nr:hypothetical protein [Flavobacteriales bacterium]